MFFKKKNTHKYNFHCPNCNCAIGDEILIAQVVALCPVCSAPLGVDANDKSSRLKWIFISYIIPIFIFHGGQFISLKFYPDQKENWIYIYVVIVIIVIAILSFRLKKYEPKLVIDLSIVQFSVRAVKEKIRPYERFLEQKIGALDFLMQEVEVRKQSGLEGSLSHILKIHNERIGGLSVEEQHEAILRINPHLNLMQLVSAEVEKAEAKINQLKSFMAEKL